MKKPIARMAKAQPANPTTLRQVLYELDNGRLAAIRLQMDEIIMGQRAIVQELEITRGSAARKFDDTIAAMTDLLHRVMKLELAEMTRRRNEKAEG